MEENIKAKGLFEAHDFLSSEMDEPMCKLKLLENLCHAGGAFKEGFHGLDDKMISDCGHGFSTILREVRETYERVQAQLQEMIEAAKSNGSGQEGGNDE